MTSEPKGPGALAAGLDASVLEAALAAGGFGQWSLDLATGALIASPTMQRLANLPDGAGLTEQDLIDAVHPEDQFAFTSALLDAVDGGRPFQLLHRLGTGDAAQWVDSRGTRVAGENDASWRVAAVTVAVGVDVSGAPSR